METVALDSVRIRVILDFLARKYSRVFRKEWKEGEKVLAIFVHQEYVFRTSSDQTIVTIVEYNQSKDRGVCTIVASGGGKGIFGWDWGSGSDGERTVKHSIMRLLATDRNVGQLYCFNCDKWDEYVVEEGQTEAICRTCGQSITVQ